MSLLDELCTIIGETLQLGARTQTLSASTPLLGNIPELDSMAVVNLITTIEERFDIYIEDDEISAETFETVGTLHDFIDPNLAA